MTNRWEDKIGGRGPPGQRTAQVIPRQIYVVGPEEPDKAPEDCVSDGALYASNPQEAVKYYVDGGEGDVANMPDVQYDPDEHVETVEYKGQKYLVWGPFPDDQAE